VTSAYACVQHGELLQRATAGSRLCRRLHRGQRRRRLADVRLPAVSVTRGCSQLRDGEGRRPGVTAGSSDARRRRTTVSRRLHRPLLQPPTSAAAAAAAAEGSVTDRRSLKRADVQLLCTRTVQTIQVRERRLPSVIFLLLCSPVLGGGAKYCDRYVCRPVSVRVTSRSHITKTT